MKCKAKTGGWKDCTDAGNVLVEVARFTLYRMLAYFPKNEWREVPGDQFTQRPSPFATHFGFVTS